MPSKSPSPTASDDFLPRFGFRLRVRCDRHGASSEIPESGQARASNIPSKSMPVRASTSWQVFRYSL